jgi:hypothetical protein
MIVFCAFSLFETTAFAQTFNVGAAIASSITISARGNCGGIDPVEHMAVYVNQELVAEFDVYNVSYANFRVDLGADMYIQELAVAFTNDSHEGDCDHNLYVDYVELNTGLKVYSNDTTSVIYDRYTFFDNIDVIPGQKAMMWTGALRFMLPHAAP